MNEDTDMSESEKPARKKKSLFREYVETIIIAFILATMIKMFLVQAFKIPTGSMEPTLHGDRKKGDRILVNKFMYYFRPYKRGDIIVFTTKGIQGLEGTLDYLDGDKPFYKKWLELVYKPHKDFIKRIVGLPGDTVEIREGHVYVNGAQLTENQLLRDNIYSPPVGPEGKYGFEGQVIQVPQDSFFCMGDNSQNSRDSRYWGFVPKKNVKGLAFMIYWPLHRMSLLR